MKRFYVSMTWHNWPEGGSYATFLDAPNPRIAVLKCKVEMASVIEGVNDWRAVLETVRDYADSWHCVDCFDIAEFRPE